MRMSKYFVPMLREVPSEAEAPSHQLMLRAGMIRQTAKGIYSWLPFGLLALKRVTAIVRDEMNEANGQELLMPTIQTADLWRESGRYDEFGPELLRFKDRGDRDLLYGPTNEEQITDIVRHGVTSYKQLPLNLYHIQWKFRDEIRPRFGVIRCREFLMKDAYSFDVDAAAARKSYDTMYASYLNIFRRMGLKPIPVCADTGAIGGHLSHEFHVPSVVGESKIIYDTRLESGSNVAAMQGMYGYTDDYSGERMEQPTTLSTCTSTEVGHVFYLGDKYSTKMNALIARGDGTRGAVQMGCYGIGVSRLVAAIIEANHDERGIIWPSEVAPFDVAILIGDDKECARLGDIIYDSLAQQLNLLYDDRDVRLGVKFNEMDLLGIPKQIIIGAKSLAQGTIEIKERATGVRTQFPINMLPDLMSVL